LGFVIAKLSDDEKLGDADEFCQARPHHGGERTEFNLYGSGYFPFALIIKIYNPIT